MTNRKEKNKMKSFIKQNQISIFFVVTLLIGRLPWYTGRGSIIIAAPSIAALIVAFLADGWKGVASVAVALAGVVVLVTTKGKLGFNDDLVSVQ